MDELVLYEFLVSLLSIETYFSFHITTLVDVRSVFGRVPDHRLEIAMAKYTNNLQARLDVYDCAQRNITTSQRRQKYYDHKAIQKSYNIGDLVWLHQPAVEEEHTTKMSRPWQGPFQVLCELSVMTYRIQPTSGSNRRQRVVHFN